MQPVFSNDTVPPEEVHVLEGSVSEMRCQTDPLANPLNTLTWYRTQNGQNREQLNYQHNVNPGGSVILNHTYSRQDLDSEFICEATQLASIHSQAVQSDGIAINVICK